MEEAGLSVIPGRMIRIAENFPTIKGEECHIIRVYVVCKVEGSADVRLSEDHDAFQWIDPKDHGSYPLIDSPTDNLQDVFVDYLALHEAGVV